MNSLKYSRCHEAAQVYAERFKWPVFPLKARGKTPVTSHGLKDGTLDRVKIQEFWSKNSDANVGIVTGKASGMFAVDIDPRHGGDKALKDLEVEFGPLPKTVIAKTGGGGLHIFFKHPGETILNKTNLRPGIDIRGDGGYIVAPPSMHESGNQYTWRQDARVDQVSLAEAPKWLLNLLTRSEKTQKELRPKSNIAIPEGQRNDTIFRIACSLRAKGLSEGSVLHALETENAEKYSPPLDVNELTNIVRQACKYPPGSAINDKAGKSWGSAIELNSKVKEWAELKALPRPLPEAPSMTPETAGEMLPNTLVSWVLDTAKRLQVPIESLSVCAIGALASVLGRKVGVMPKSKDSWLVLPIFWTAIIDRPGRKKTATIEEALRPLRKLENQAREEFQKSQSQIEAEKDSLDAQISSVKNQIKEACGDSTEIILLENKLLELREREKKLQCHERRFRTNDATIEKLALLLNENPNGLLLSRDELCGWLRGLDKQGHEGDREFFLEAWNGKGSFSVDRVGRGTIHVPALCLSIIGGIQPGKLESYVFDAVQGGSGDDGFLQRFQLMVYPENGSKPEFVDLSPDLKARNKVEEVFERLHNAKPQDFGAQNFEGEPIPFLRFSPAAQTIFNQWSEDLEHRLHSDEVGCSGFEAHLAKYRSLMPAIALVFHLIEWAAHGKLDLSISEETVRRAAVWCDFLEAHAKKVYSIAIDTEIHSAHALARKIKEKKVKDGDAIRQIYRHHWSLLKKPDDVDSALAVLEEAGWVRTERISQKELGAPTEILRLHPALKGEA